MRNNMIALAIAAGLSASLGHAMAPKAHAPVPNIGLRLMDGSAAPLPMMHSAGRPGKGKNARPHHPSLRYVAQDKRDAQKARNRRMAK